MLLNEQHIIKQRIEAHLRATGWETKPELTMAAGETWHGVATCEQYPNIVVCFFMGSHKATRNSEKQERMLTLSPGDTCPQCAGNKHQPDGWTLADAQANPVAYFRQKNAAAGFGMVAWFHPSPEAFTDDGFEKCRKCAGRGYLLKSEDKVIHTWPTLRPTPDKMHWHVQYKDRIAHSGTIPLAISGENSSLWQPALNDFYQVIISKAVAARSLLHDADMQRRSIPGVIVTEPVKATVGPMHEISIQGKWLWFKPITELSSQAKREIAIKGGEASHKRPGWYFFKSIDAMTHEELMALA